MGDANLANTEIEFYINMKAEDIKNVANLYINNENSNTLYYKKLK